MEFTMPIRIYTAGQLRQEHPKAFDRARETWESDWSYTVIQEELNSILERDAYLNGDGFWPEGVQVHKCGSGRRSWDVGYSLYDYRGLQMVADVDLEVLSKEVNAPELTSLILELLYATTEQEYDEPDYTFKWDGRSRELTHDYADLDSDWLKQYLKNLETELLDALETRDTESFTPEQFIREAGCNQWLFDENGRWKSWPTNDLPDELAALLEEESEH